MNKRGSLSICGSYDVGSFSVVVNQPEANVLMKGQFPGTFCNDGGTMVYTLQDRSWAAPVCVWGLEACGDVGVNDVGMRAIPDCRARGNPHRSGYHQGNGVPRSRAYWHSIRAAAR